MTQHSCKEKFLLVKYIPLNICTHYFSSMQNKASFHGNGPNRRPNILDLDYVDVCMVDDKFLSGTSYLLVLLTITQEKVWTLILKSKDHVFGIFKYFHARVER